MRIHESGVGRGLDTPSASSTLSMPSPSHTPLPSAPTATSPNTLSASCTPTIHSLAHTPSPSAPTTTSSTITVTEADTDTAPFEFDWNLLVFQNFDISTTRFYPELRLVEKIKNSVKSATGRDGPPTTNPDERSSLLMSATNKLDTDMSTRCDGCRELTTRVLKLEVDVDLLTEIIASLLKFNKIKPPEHDTKDMKNINEPDLMNLKKPVKGYRRRAQRNKRQRTKSLDKSSDSTEMDGNKVSPPLLPTLSAVAVALVAAAATSQPTTLLPLITNTSHLHPTPPPAPPNLHY
ncbi:hypothetical protein SprV_0301030900 [Sparganum proliferum]